MKRAVYKDIYNNMFDKYDSYRVILNVISQYILFG